MDWLGGDGFGATMTCRSDRLPGEIDRRYIHKKTDSSDNTEVAQLFNPVVATNNTDKVVGMETGNDGEGV